MPYFKHVPNFPETSGTGSILAYTDGNATDVFTIALGAPTINPTTGNLTSGSPGNQYIIDLDGIQGFRNVSFNKGDFFIDGTGILLGETYAFSFANVSSQVVTFPDATFTVVGDTTTQTLTNKTFTVTTWDDQASTPSNPAAGFYKTYFKSDGKFYKLNSSGVETEIVTGGGGGTTLTWGETTIDFGAFPGSSETSLNITGQTGILTTSFVEAWLFPKDTADHTADEHVYESIKVVAGNIVAGTGFTIYAVNTNQIHEGLEYVYGANNSTLAGGLVKPSSLQSPTRGGLGTRISGLWTVRWRWG